jgi:methylitaconate Delta-isomerase
MGPTRIRCVIMRGGTSKAIFLREHDLPPQGPERDRVILKIFGSPDKRQIDGLGGADPLTSKLAIIGTPEAQGADINYTFGQVEIARPNIDYKSLCGNISSAVGHYAVYEGLVTPVEPVTTVHVFNTNLKRMLHIEVPVKNGKPVTEGSYQIPGVPGNSAKINLDLSETSGGTTGQLLPTGNPIDTLEVVGVGNIEVSLVDIGNAHVFVRAEDLGLKGTETPTVIDNNSELLERLEKIRAAAAVRMGMISYPEGSVNESPATPILGIISPPQAYRNYLNDEQILAEQVDLISRLLYMQVTHKTYAGTSTVCTGVAAKIPGTIVFEAAANSLGENLEVRIGHPAGVIETESLVTSSGDKIKVQRATLGRTARRIMEGHVFIESYETQSV